MNIPPVEADSPLHVATPASLQEECPPETGGRKNIHLTISYDGTNFCGWQRQDKSAAGRPVRTVQGELERALEKLAKEPVEVIGSGRTDSGVHAYGQAANFFSPITSMGAESYVPALNSLLPENLMKKYGTIPVVGWGMVIGLVKSTDFNSCLLRFLISTFVIGSIP